MYPAQQQQPTCDAPGLHGPQVEAIKAQQLQQLGHLLAAHADQVLAEGGGHGAQSSGAGSTGQLLAPVVVGAQGEVVLATGKC